MGRAKRYSNEKKLNIKKVIAAAVAIAVVIMFIFAIIKLLNGKPTKDSESYYAILSDNKYGVVNSKGEKIIEPAYEELIIVPNKYKDVFICTYDVDYENDTYKTKALNSKNEEIYKDYDLIEAIEILDKNNNISYNTGVLKVAKDGKVGLINFDGKEILKTDFDSIKILNGSDNKFLIEKDTKFGLVNEKGETIIEPEYKNIISTNNNDTYIIVNSDDKYGIITSGKVIADPQYENVKQFIGENTYVVKKDNKWIEINQENETIISGDYDDIAAINNSEIVFIKDSKYGVMNTNKEVIIPAEYEEIEFSFDSKYIVKKSGKYGVVDSNNIVVIPIEKTYILYEENKKLLRASTDGIKEDIIDENLNVALSGIISEFNTEEGYIYIRDEQEHKYYNFNFEEKESKDILKNNTLFLVKKDGKYGFKDANDKIIVECIYDDATEQNSLGFAAVQKDGKWGSIDKTGKIVIEPTYNLSENLRVNFIGKWHLGIDLNMNYYTDK